MSHFGTCPDQPGMNPMYQSLSADKVLLSNQCSVVLGLINPTFFKPSNHVRASTNICNSVLEFLDTENLPSKYLASLPHCVKHKICTKGL